ncbi:hypothetical protein ACTFIR_005685 [Dictyostelium discoideum]
MNVAPNKYTSFSKMYAASGHYYSQGCNNKLNKIKGEQKLQNEFYQRLSKITDGMSHQGKSDYTIMVDFENYIGPFFKNYNNGNDYEIIPYGLTIDIPEFRSSCRINHYNCNEFSCHTCDKPRGADYLLKEGNYRNRKDIIDLHYKNIENIQFHKSIKNSKEI